MEPAFRHHQMKLTKGLKLEFVLLAVGVDWVPPMGPKGLEGEEAGGAREGEEVAGAVNGEKVPCVDPMSNPSPAPVLDPNPVPDLPLPAPMPDPLLPGPLPAPMADPLLALDPKLNSKSDPLVLGPVPAPTPGPLLVDSGREAELAEL